MTSPSLALTQSGEKMGRSSGATHTGAPSRPKRRRVPSTPATSTPNPGRAAGAENTAHPSSTRQACRSICGTRVSEQVTLSKP
eukprot:3498712-Pyramimonas_sp.AAC.1